MCDQLFESEWAFSRRSQEQGPLGQGHWQPLCRDLVNPLSTNRSSYFARYTHYFAIHTIVYQQIQLYLQNRHTLFCETHILATRSNYFTKPIHYFARHTHGTPKHAQCFVKHFIYHRLNNFATRKMLNLTKLHYLTSNPSNTHFVSMSAI